MESITVIGGTGQFGNSLSHRLATFGYQVMIGSRSREKGAMVAEEMNREFQYTNPIRGGSNDDFLENDIIVLAVPPKEAIKLLSPYKDSLKNKILWDVTVPLKFGKFIRAETDEGKSNYELLRDFFSESKVVGCLKTIAADLIRDTSNVGKIHSFIITTDEDAYIQTENILSRIGFKPVRVRGKFHAHTLERMTALAIQLNKEYPGSHVAYSLVGLNLG